MSEINLNKLKLQTPNIYEENIKKLKELFPQIVSEDKIDFDILKQLLSNTIVEADDERYRLDWVGKKRSLLKANTPINKTLRPCKNESVDFENTKNLYIEGDNFEVLKLLQESYLNKIKMIYIDPPYNTGKDSFTYPDDYSKSRSDFEDEIGLRDDEGNKLFKNTDSNGRFHSDWLSMMYERLLVSRDLLKDDGVIFISIDDNEVHNLRKICDEVFGEGNFVVDLIRKTKSTTNDAKTGINNQHENCLVYTKNISEINLLGGEKNLSNYKNIDNDPNGDWISADPSAKSGTQTNYFEIKNPYTGKIDLPPIGMYWRFSQNTIQNHIDTGIISFKKEHKENERGFIYKRYKDRLQTTKKTLDSLIFTDNLFMNQKATKDLLNLGLAEYFTYPKGADFILKIIQHSMNKDELILDFFSGSSTTAHAVMQLNAQDDGNRKFIMVQIPENTDEKSESYKAGYKNICEIGKERIRRAGAKILEDNKDKDLSSLDIGFRVLKVDSSNMKDVYYHPNEIKQNQLKMFETNIKEDRSDLDLLFSIMLDLGICLDLKITTKIIDDKKLYFIENSELIVCFEENITLKIIEAIKEEKPYKVVLKDGCFANDTQKINAILELSLISQISVI